MLSVKKGCDILILNIILSVAGFATATVASVEYARGKIYELCFCVMLMLGIALTGAGISCLLA